MSYWNEEIETMDRTRLNELKLRRLQETIFRTYSFVPFYRQQMDAAGVKPTDIKSLSDIEKLPFTNKSDLRDNYPFGLFAIPMSEVVRIHSSSGTTGKPTVVGYSRNDLDNWANLIARGLTSVGATRHSVVQVSYGYGLFTGGLGAHAGAEKLGASVIPASGGNTSRQVMLMRDFGTTHLACTPSYALHMYEVMLKGGIDPGELRLKAGIFGAEPWSENMRRDIEKKLQIKAYDIFGLSEIIGPGVAIECQERAGLHLWEDHFLAEIIDPETGKVLPPGEQGELVITTITKEALPMVRYRTHDLTQIDLTPCACGRTHMRIGKVLARSDDMLIIRGVNVFPSMVEHVLLKSDGVEPHYLLVVDRVGPLDVLEIQVEVSEKVFSDEVRKMENLNKQLKKDLESALGVQVNVRLKEPGSMPRSEGKAQRVIDNRKI